MVLRLGKKGRLKKVEKKGKLRDYVSWWPSADMVRVEAVVGGFGRRSSSLSASAELAGERMREGSRPVMAGALHVGLSANDAPGESSSLAPVRHDA